MMSGEVLERLVQEDDREGDLEDDDPLGAAQRSDLKYQLRDRQRKREEEKEAGGVVNRTADEIRTGVKLEKKKQDCVYLLVEAPHTI